MQTRVLLIELLRDLDKMFPQEYWQHLIMISCTHPDVLACNVHSFRVI